MFASNIAEEQSEDADFDHFCNQFNLLALNVSVLCAAVSCFSFNNEKYFENKNIKLQAYWNEINWITNNCGVSVKTKTGKTLKY